MINTNLLDEQNVKEYIKLKDKTVVYYLPVDSITEDQLEDYMIESFPYSYNELYT